MHSVQGKTYYRLDYDVILIFGLTELKAQIGWLEKVWISLLCAYLSTNLLQNIQGIEKRYDPLISEKCLMDFECDRSPASIVYED